MAQSSVVPAFHAMSIKQRILIVAALSVGLTLAVAALGLLDISRYGHMIGRYDRDFADAQYAERMDSLVTQAMADSRGIYAAQSLAEARPFDTDLRSDLARIHDLAVQWRRAGNPEDPAKLKAIEAEIDAFIATRSRIDALGAVSLKSADQVGEAVDRATTLNTLQDDLSGLDATLQTRLGSEQYKLDRFKAQGQHLLLVFALCGSALVLAFIIWFLLAAITRPLHRASTAIVELADGNLDIVLPSRIGKDEISVLWGAIGVLRHRAIEARKAFARSRHDAA